MKNPKHEIRNSKRFDRPFDRPFDRLTVLSQVEGLTVLSPSKAVESISIFGFRIFLRTSGTQRSVGAQKRGCPGRSSGRLHQLAQVLRSDRAKFRCDGFKDQRPTGASFNKLFKRNQVKIYPLWRFMVLIAHRQPMLPRRHPATPSYRPDVLPPRPGFQPTSRKAHSPHHTPAPGA